MLRSSCRSIRLIEGVLLLVCMYTGGQEGLMLTIRQHSNARVWSLNMYYIETLYLLKPVVRA